MKASKGTPSATRNIVDTKNFWTNADNRKWFMDWLGNQLGFERKDQWYNARAIDFHQRGARKLLGIFDHSLFNLLKDVYPEHEWIPYAFGVPKNHWSTEQNRKSYFDWLGKQLGVHFPNGWYSVKASDVVHNGGSGILSHYEQSLSKALQDIYPEVSWQPWQFESAPKGFWQDLNGQRDYLNWLSKELNLADISGWYQVKQADFMDRKGGSLLNFYRWSQYKMLRSVFPEHKWLPWEFSYVPRGVWEEEGVAEGYLRWLSQELRLSGDWHLLTAEQVASKKGKGLLAKYGGLESLLDAFFPNRERSTVKRQDALRSVVRSLFGELSSEKIGTSSQ